MKNFIIGFIVGAVTTLVIGAVVAVVTVVVVSANRITHALTTPVGAPIQQDLRSPQQDSAGAADRTAEETGGAAPADVSGIARSIAGSPELMSRVGEIQQDPGIQEVLDDPDIRQALEQGNYLQLLNNPKIRKLAEQENLQSLTGAIMQQLGGAGSGADSETKP